MHVTAMTTAATAVFVVTPTSLDCRTFVRALELSRRPTGLAGAAARAQPATVFRLQSFNGSVDKMAAGGEEIRRRQNVAVCMRSADETVTTYALC